MPSWMLALYVVINSTILKRNMKFKDLTDHQVLEVGKLALQDIINFDFITSSVKGQHDLKYRFLVKREIYDEKENWQVIRVYIDGMPGCYCAIWEEDCNVDTYEDEQVVETANQVKIFKYLVALGLIQLT